MTIIGYILMAIGIMSLFGNLTGAGGANDPDHSGVNQRAIIWVVVIGVGASLVWWL